MTVEILLVEDSPGDARLMLEAFSESSLRTNLQVARDGVEALDVLHRHGASGDRPLPDLIILDLNLPRKDGREVLQEIKNDPALLRIPVVVLTTSDADSDVLDAYANHANCYIRKPVDYQSFLGVMRAIEDFWLRTARLPRAGSA